MPQFLGSRMFFTNLRFQMKGIPYALCSPFLGPFPPPHEADVILPKNNSLIV